GSIDGFLGPIAVAASLGAAASLQAIVGSYLVRRFVGLPNLLSKEQELFQASAELEREFAVRQRAEGALAERARLAAMAAAIGVALSKGDALRTALQRCAEAIVRQLDVPFARIWTFNRAEKVLELQASAGMYAHLDGPHSRVPLG